MYELSFFNDWSRDAENFSVLNFTFHSCNECSGICVVFLGFGMTFNVIHMI